MNSFITEVNSHYCVENVKSVKMTKTPAEARAYMLLG
jgi:hypothetical protein